jgi:hypothetical protein
MGSYINSRPVSYITASADPSWGRKTFAYPLFCQPVPENLMFHQAVELVGHFSELDRGWDGYNARPISDAVIGNSISTLTEMASIGKLLPVPAVSPEVAGTIGMSWENQMGEAYLEVGETRYSGYIETRSGKEEYFQGDAKNHKQEALTRIYERLFSSAQSTPILLYQTTTDSSTHTIWSVLF